MCFSVNSLESPPTKEGDYLFYYGNSDRPFFAVNTFRFTVEEDEFETVGWYLEERYDRTEPSLWFELPTIAT